MPGLWVDGRPLAAQIGWYSCSAILPFLTRTNAETEIILAHIYRARAAGRADGGDGAVGRRRGAGVGAVFQFRQFRPADAAAANSAATRQRLVRQRLLPAVPPGGTAPPGARGFFQSPAAGETRPVRAAARAQHP